MVGPKPLSICSHTDIISQEIFLVLSYQSIFTFVLNKTVINSKIFDILIFLFDIYLNITYCRGCWSKLILPSRNCNLRFFLTGDYQTGSSLLCIFLKFGYPKKTLSGFLVSTEFMSPRCCGDDKITKIWNLVAATNLPIGGQKSHWPRRRTR